MLSAQLAGVRTNDFASADLDFRLDIAANIANRRRALGYTPLQLSESAGVTEEDLRLVEQGAGFAGSHEVACAAIDTVERLEILRAGKAHLHSV